MEFPFPQTRVGVMHTCFMQAPTPAAPVAIRARFMDMYPLAIPHPILKGSPAEQIGDMPATRQLNSLVGG